MTALRHDAGYSLMELLVVLLLLSFITLAVSGGFRFGTRIWETTDRAVVDQRHVVSLQTVLRSLLASAVP
jgi:prepilin-type N-terminal cleavage/methylation domain-containing protein